MLFSTDKQTLEDLNIFGKHGCDSIFHLYNRCFTRGGSAVMEEMFRYPLSDCDAINRRVNITKFFLARGTAFPFESSLFDHIETYLANIDERTKLNAQDDSVVKKLGRVMGVNTETAIIYKGVNALVELLRTTKKFIASLQGDDAAVYQSERDTINNLIDEMNIARVWGSNGKLGHDAIADLDVLFRFRNRDIVQKLLRHLYHLDVYISNARVASANGFAFPQANRGEKELLQLRGVYHPQVPHAVPNDMEVSKDGNVIFLTGANMAGKSTFMKSLSIAMFLGHMGFPVPASSMEFSVLDGIYTTINLPDNLGLGASHFYAEVLRVKKMAHELRQGRKLFIVFDELFRGTNVKDAYEATVAIIEGLATRKTSVFVISTHIIEAGEVLRAACPNIQFLYLPTRMRGMQPEYTYTLEKGITDDRHGMIIVNNEKILDMLQAGRRSDKQHAGFMVDKQTLEDLNLLGRFKPNSIFNIFNKTKTLGGQRLLEDMFRNPLSDAEAINQRSGEFQYFQEKGLEFPFQYESFLLAENYLDGSAGGNILVSTASMSRKKLMASFLRDTQYQQLHAGLIATIDALNKFKEMLKRVDIAFVEESKAILQSKHLSWLDTEKGVKTLSLQKMAKYDLLLRHRLRREMEVLRVCLYKLDVYIAVGSVAREQGFTYAEALPASADLLEVNGLRHPAISRAVANSIVGGRNNNVMFLTGANMAGKSTLMKSAGIAIYLAHMGFPVPAAAMRFSVRDGMYTSINVADNLSQGYSHFYAEVLRIKTVAEQVSAGRNLIVIFDELFKGTNVKDAYDATAFVTMALTKYQNCFFIISTHIVEVGDALREGSYPVQFAYLPTIMEGNIPRYTYQLAQGISSDKHGMLIINNEKILETLNQ